jgi:hypothetical protein
MRAKRASNIKNGHSSSAISVSEVGVFDPDQLEGRERCEGDFLLNEFVESDCSLPAAPSWDMLFEHIEWGNYDDLVVIRVLRSLVSQRVSVLELPLIEFESRNVHNDQGDRFVGLGIVDDIAVNEIRVFLLVVQFELQGHIE